MSTTYIEQHKTLFTPSLNRDESVRSGTLPIKSNGETDEALNSVVAPFETVYAIAVPYSSPLYGYLYNWYAVNNGEHKLEPDGWHVPNDSEWTTLTTYLGGNEVAGGKIKETGLDHWNSPNVGATNKSGFTALPNGYRDRTGVFNSIGDVFTALCKWGDRGIAYMLKLNFSDTTAEINSGYMQAGYSVRCLRDSDEGWSEGEQVTDYDGNIYDTVQIGTQVWMVQNLAVKHYNDGTAIPNLTDATEWKNDMAGAYCAYENNENYVMDSDHENAVYAIDTNDERAKGWQTIS